MSKAPMDNAAKLHDALDRFVGLIGREAIATLLFEPIPVEELDWYLARLSHHVAPSYLPFAADDMGIMMVHLWPGRPVEASPIVYVCEDEQEARFICDCLASLPAGFWLWIGHYFRDRPRVLRQAVEAMEACIPNAKPVPDALWTLLEESPEYQPSWWSARCSEHTARAWQLADVGHPFVGMPCPDLTVEAEEALPQIEPFVRAHPEPEMISVLVATQVEAGIMPRAEDVLAVLSAEAWRRIDCLASGWWLASGTGMCAWDAALRHLPDPAKILDDTPFAPLADRLETYSGEDRQGPLTLAGIAQAFRRAGDYENALIQLRNATTLAILTLGRYRRELAIASAAVCETIAADSLAAAVAQRSVQIDREAL